MTKSQKNYPAHKLEFIALKWAITEKFSRLLKPEAIYNNSPLAYVPTTSKLDATGHRWIAALSQFVFDIQYRPGLRNADVLSRYPTIEHEVNVIDTSSVKAICGCLSIPCSSIALNMNIVDTLEVPGQTQAQKELCEVRTKPREDKFIEKWRKAVIDQLVPKHTTGRKDKLQ